VSLGPALAQEPPTGADKPAYRVLGQSETEDGDRRGRFVVIRRGDTLGKIAGKADVPLAAITAANPDADPRKLMPGDLIRVPEIADSDGDELPGSIVCPGDSRC
jgi:nucleoid-associated protein YgaU